MVIDLEKSIGNSDLISSDEDMMAGMLRKMNFDIANSAPADIAVKNSFYVKYGKRVMDIVLSFVAVTMLLPFNLFFAMCTYFDVGKPIFYRQTRSGKDGKGFVLVKFRNMNNATGENGELLPPSRRITKFGQFMRKYSLDELLNFWSILKGDMSLIGPRPLPVFFFDRMSDRHKKRTAVKPGLECPRIFVEDDPKLCQYHKQFENDVRYVENISFATDVKMVFALVKMVFNMRKRSKTASGASSIYFVGYDGGGHALDMMSAYKEYADEFERYKNSRLVDSIE